MSSNFDIYFQTTRRFYIGTIDSSLNVKKLSLIEN